MTKKSLKRPRNDNPEWTREDFAKARPLAEINPGLIERVKRARGRPKLDSPKEQITLRIDKLVLDAYRREGHGWQTTLNGDLLKLVKRRQKAA